MCGRNPTQKRNQLKQLIRQDNSLHLKRIQSSHSALKVYVVLALIHFYSQLRNM